MVSGVSVGRRDQRIRAEIYAMIIRKLQPALRHHIYEIALTAAKIEDRLICERRKYVYQAAVKPIQA